MVTLVVQYKKEGEEKLFDTMLGILINCVCSSKNDSTVHIRDKLEITCTYIPPAHGIMVLMT